MKLVARYRFKDFGDPFLNIEIGDGFNSKCCEDSDKFQGSCFSISKFRLSVGVSRCL